MKIVYMEFWFRGRLIRAKCFVASTRLYDNIYVVSEKHNKIFHFRVTKWLWFRPVDGSKGVMPMDLYDALERAVRELSKRLEKEPDPAA